MKTGRRPTVSERGPQSNGPLLVYRRYRVSSDGRSMDDISGIGGTESEREINLISNREPLYAIINMKSCRFHPPSYEVLRIRREIVDTHTQYPATKMLINNVPTSRPTPKYARISKISPEGAELAKVALKTSKLDSEVRYHLYSLDQFIGLRGSSGPENVTRKLSSHCVGGEEVMGRVGAFSLSSGGGEVEAERSLAPSVNVDV